MSHLLRYMLWFSKLPIFKIFFMTRNDFFACNKFVKLIGILIHGMNKLGILVNDIDQDEHRLDFIIVREFGSSEGIDDIVHFLLFITSHTICVTVFF